MCQATSIAGTHVATDNGQGGTHLADKILLCVGGGGRGILNFESESALCPFPELIMLFRWAEKGIEGNFLS